LETCRGVYELLYRSVLSGVILRKLVRCLLWNGAGDFNVQLPEKDSGDDIHSDGICGNIEERRDFECGWIR
jgi:hypothetical protein